MHGFPWEWEVENISWVNWGKGLEGWELEGEDWVNWMWEACWSQDGGRSNKRDLDGEAFQG